MLLRFSWNLAPGIPRTDPKPGQTETRVMERKNEYLIREMMIIGALLGILLLSSIIRLL